MDETLQLRLLGSPKISLGEVSLAETLPVKAQAILYYLAVTGQPHLRASLASLLWGDVSDDAARTNLRKALANLRERLGGYLELDGQSVTFKPGCSYWVDVTDFVARVGSLSSAPDIVRLQEAVNLYQGNFLSGYYVRNAPDFEAWMLAEQARLHELVIQALHTLADHYGGQGELAEGIAYTRQLLSLEPWREEAHRQLMLLLARAGQRSAALAQFEICRHMLAEELSVKPGRETLALYERIRDGALERESRGHEAEEQGTRSGGDIFSTVPASPALAFSSGQTVSRLPSQPTRFVGRAKELADIIRRLTDRDCRLLTLVGPGGIGKTRLAIQTAQTFIESDPGGEFFANGVLFVSLVAVESSHEMVAAIAEAASFSFYHNVSPQQQLLDYLQPKALLLVLDNFEHLLASAAGDSQMGAVELVADLLAAAPQVKILVTSRETLNLQQAWFHPVEGLSCPSNEAGTQNREAEGLENYDAVQLFVQSAQRTRVDFSLAAERAHVIRICQLVEGMPLAIELAATWLKVLPAAKIVREIENSLDILSTRLQNLPERHRSVRAAFEQSWRLLTQEEGDALKRLAVFLGSFDQSAAEQVAGASLITLAILLEKSLLRVTARGRYHLHELLRQFAAEKLVASWAEGPDLYERHSTYYLEFLKKREQRLAGKEQRQALDEIGQEIDNIRPAWHWAITQHNLEIIQQIADSLYNFYQIRSRYQEGQELFAGAVVHLQQADTLAGQPLFKLTLARLEARQGAFCYFLGDYEAASRHFQLSLQTANSPPDQAFVYYLLGNMARLQGKRATAEECLGKSLAISREMGDLDGVAEALLGLTDIAASFGEYETAKHLASEALAISRRLERPDRVAQALCSLAWGTTCLGAYGEAEAYYRESLAISQEIGDQSGMALALEFIGWIAWCVGGTRLAEAPAYYEKALAIYREIGERSRLSMCLADLALALNDLGAYAQAQQHSQEGLALTIMTGNLGLRSFNLCCLGAAACGLGDFSTSRKYLTEALQIAWARQIPDHSLNALFYLAVLLVKESAAAPEPVKVQAKANALELLILAINHLTCWQAIRDRATRLQAQLEAELPPNIVATAKRRATERSLEAVVAEILNQNVSTTKKAIKKAAG